jgi:hypothetical protein
MDAELAELLAFIDSAACLRVEFEARWVGRRVRLCERIDLPSPDEGHVLLNVGAVGWIVQLRLDRDAPFIVEFPGFPCHIAPLLTRLGLVF